MVAVRTKAESGLLNGVAYRFYYTDGSGNFANSPDRNPDTLSILNDWNTSCSKDRITDEKTCSLLMGDLKLWVDDKGNSSLGIGIDRFPGSSIYIRIDKGQPISINEAVHGGYFSLSESAVIIKQIAKAKTVITRYQKWPRSNYIDKEFSTYGFNEALAYLRWAVARIR